MLTVLVGTQTGVAEEVGDEIAREALWRGAKVQVLHADERPVAEWEALSPVIFVVSTTGQGDMPRTLLRSWDMLRCADCPALPNLKFAVFGLGDSQYEQFNYAAKKLHNRLSQLDAAALLHRGLGDDQDGNGYEQELQPWLAKLWPTLGLPSERTQERPMPTVLIRKSDAAATDVGALRTESVFHLRVVSNARVSLESHWQRVHCIEIERQGIQFACGDALGVYPCARNEDVALMLSFFEEGTADKVVTIEANTAAFATQIHRAWFGKPVSVRTLLTHVFDIAATARRSLFAVLAQHATDEEDKERLLELANPATVAEYDAYCMRERRSTVEVLQDFKTVTLPFSEVLSVLPVMQPRYFSIASAPSVDAETLGLCVAQVAFDTPMKRARRGLCSTQLVESAPGDVLECCIMKTMLLQPDAAKPLILVGPGTGVAPCRAFARERQAGTAPTILFTGNRSSSTDYLYGAEWDAAGPPLVHVPAFSRMEWPAKYVQHAILSRAEAIARALGEGAAVIISGNAKRMPFDVESTITSIVAHRLMKGDEVQAKKFIRQMKAEGLYQTDTWA